ncbi:MAG: tripartite tricarboxylate transporter substrate binding protein [Betaproteobacteria bacterium]|nr:tripartite tricarboxylate transporter substrate binding protein [Betaproteobacteria bacterium]
MHAVRLLLILLSMTPLAALAQSAAYPAKPLRLIAPFFAGASQILAYLLSEKLAESLGQPVVVDPRPGGGGNIGAEVAARSAPDGYTLAVLSTSHAVSASMLSKLRYDVLKDFAPVSLVATVPQLIVVHPSLPVKTLKELAALGRANPGKLSYGSGGVGSSGHLGGEHFAALNKIKMLHVPYKGGSIALTHILSGEADIVIVTVPATIPFINAGKLRGLAVLDTKRTPQLPHLPTSAEAGMPELQVVSWYGVVVPAGTPASIIQRLNKDIVALMQTADTAQRFAKVGMEAVHGTPAALGDYIKADVARWGKVIREANIKVE